MAIHPVVRKVGWVSFFTDAASEMLYPLVPIFLTVTLGAPVFAVGVVEGLADGVATGLQAASGIIADRIRRHRLMIAIGYGVAALAKPLLAIAPNWGFVAGLRVADRTGKAVRGVPRDLMITEVTTPQDRGRAFGFHRAMDTAGAVIGPLIALGALSVLGAKNLRPIFLIAIVPGIASMLFIFKLPKITDRKSGKRWEPGKLPWRGRFGGFMAVITLFALGNSSDAFLLLRAKNLGLTATQVILAYVVFNIVYTAASFPAGKLSDRVSRLRIYGGGLVAFVAVYVGFAVTDSAAAVWPLLAIYGCYKALTDGIGRVLVVESVPDNIRGKALGVSQATQGAGVLVAGVVAGILWDTVSPAAPFVVGAATAAVAWLVLLAVSRTQEPVRL